MGNRTSGKWCLYRNPGMEIWCGKITYTGSKCKRCRCTSSKSILYRMYVSDSGFGSDHGGLLVITDKGMVPGYLAESVYYSRITQELYYFSLE